MANKTQQEEVYVVAWQYRGGGGFDWYKTGEAANRAFEDEKITCMANKDDPCDWTAYRFDFHRGTLTDDQTTDAIGERLDELCLAAFRWFPRGQEAKAPLVFNPSGREVSPA